MSIFLQACIEKDRRQGITPKQTSDQVEKPAEKEQDGGKGD